MSYLLKKHLSLSILLLLLICKPVKSIDIIGLVQFSLPFVGGTLYDNYNNSKTYTEKYGYYSKYFPGFDWMEVGTCHPYYGTDRKGIACKQLDGSWKIKR